MPKRFVASVCLCAAVVLLSGCQFVINEGLRGNGDLVTETRDIGAIDTVRLACQGDLIIVLGDREELIIQAESNLIEHIVTKVDSGTLVIKTTNDYNLRPTKKLRFALTVRSLEEIVNTGSGDIEAPELDVDTFTARLSGSGDLNVDYVLAKECSFRATGSGDIAVDKVTADFVEVDLSGSGGVVIDDGRATRFKASLSGSGGCDARSLEVDEARVRATGSGGVSIRANDRIEGRLSGSGDLYYYGSPDVEVKATGSGRPRSR